MKTPEERLNKYQDLLNKFRKEKFSHYLCLKGGLRDNNEEYEIPITDLYPEMKRFVESNGSHSAESILYKKDFRLDNVLEWRIEVLGLCIEEVELEKRDNQFMSLLEYENIEPLEEDLKDTETETLDMFLKNQILLEESEVYKEYFSEEAIINDKNYWIKTAKNCDSIFTPQEGDICSLVGFQENGNYMMQVIKQDWLDNFTDSFNHTPSKDQFIVWLCFMLEITKEQFDKDYKITKALN